MVTKAGGGGDLGRLAPEKQQKQQQQQQQQEQKGLVYHSRAVIGPLDIKSPPVKKHMVQGHLLPSLKGAATSFFTTRRRRITIEIQSPSSTLTTAAAATATTTLTSPPALIDVDLENERLADQDRVVLRIFRRATKRSGGGGDIDGNDSSSDGGTYVCCCRGEALRCVAFCTYNLPEHFRNKEETEGNKENTKCGNNRSYEFSTRSSVRFLSSFPNLYHCLAFLGGRTIDDFVS
jgi:hypothetical protein